MSWYRTRWWRFALSPSRCGVMWDTHGRWRHVLGHLWVLIERGAAYPYARIENRPDGPRRVTLPDGSGATEYVIARKVAS